MYLLLTALILSPSLTLAWTPGNGVQPHIVVILADDLGYDDVGWRNSNLDMPNIDNLANSGIKFNRFYTHPKCSPSRAALLTGRYAYKTGFNEGALASFEMGGLEMGFSTLAEKLNAKGYTSHMTGKWHLGWCQDDYLPQNRGFSTFLGIHHSGAAHWDYTSEVNDNDVYQLFEAVPGPAEEPYQTEYTAGSGTYSTELYANHASSIINSHDTSSPMFLYMAMQNIHGPQEAPDEYLDMYDRNDFSWRKRRITAAMLTALDDAVGTVVTALNSTGMLDETVIVFASDNGGQPTAGAASNEPLRGGKNTFWEGGLRVPSVVYSPLFSSYSGDNDCYFHITDWFTTLLGFAGETTSSLDVDGIDQWETITSQGSTCKRDHIFHNIVVDSSDNVETATVTDGQYKLIWGSPGDLNGWYFQDGTEISATVTDTYLLYDILADEKEETNLLDDDPDGTYEAIRDTLIASIEAEKSNIYEFSLDGKCDAEDALSTDGLHWQFGCCET